MIGVVFDCDGTLVDTEPLHFLSWQQALAERGISFTQEDCSLISGLSGIEIAKRFDLQNPEILFDDKRKHYEKLQKKGVAPIHRTVNFVKKIYELKDFLGLKFAVASAAHKEEILINLTQIGLENYFEVIISGQNDLSHFSDPEGTNKPKPYIYLHTAHLLGLSPHMCMAFEDTQFGVDAAASAGFITFAVPSSFTKTQNFSKAHYLISSEEDLEISDILYKMKKISDSFTQLT